MSDKRKLGQIELTYKDGDEQTEIWMARVGKYHCVLYWSIPRQQFSAPKKGGGEWFANGFTESAVNYVATWVCKATAYKHLKTAREELRYGLL